MPAIGHVTKSKDGKSFKGQLKTLSFRAPIDILPNTAKNGDNQPDYRVYSQAIEVGAGWVRKAESSGKDYVSLSLSDPAFGPKKLAVIEKSREFTLVPWRPVLERNLGKSVSGVMRGDAISWRFGRQRGGPT